MELQFHFTETHSEQEIPKKIVTDFNFIVAYKVISHCAIPINSLHLTIDFSSGTSDSASLNVNLAVSPHSLTGTEVLPRAYLLKPFNSSAKSNFKPVILRSLTPNSNFQVFFKLYQAKPTFYWQETGLFI